MLKVIFIFKKKKFYHFIINMHNTAAELHPGIKLTSNC